MIAYFPKNEGQRYWKMHYAYVLNSLKAAGFEVRFKAGLEVAGSRFKVEVYGREIVIDFRDFFDVGDAVHSDLPYFKFHRNAELRAKYKNVFPLGPISVDDWPTFLKIRSNGQYTAKGRTIMNNQRAYGDAVTRRKKVKTDLTRKFGGRLDARFHRQGEFWRRGLDCLVSVCVPGARNDILDRGQVQFMGLGICTISPELVCELPYEQMPQPGVHYITCDPGYRDLAEKIRWCEEHREECVEIGKAARELFDRCCLPKAKWEYVRQVLTRE